MIIREFTTNDIPQMTAIWNEIVEEGIAFPQKETLTEDGAREFFSAQSFTGVCEENGEILGLYILHPNNVGRCGHISNASYAVKSNQRGRGIGRKLVTDCLKKAKELRFGILQFNAVVKTNLSARHLYESLGFTALGTIPKGFLMKNGEYEDIVVFYKEL
ncbi:MAG: GNAT family N-acetyltransferase [Firmicutes bacterium]|nr:GNAT family N-acetyltransferase [Bacillota bacterium]